MMFCVLQFILSPPGAAYPYLAMTALLGVSYHSPNSDSLNFDHLCSLLKQVEYLILIVGDFNMPCNTC